MSANPRVRNLFNIPLVESPFGPRQASDEGTPECGWEARVERVRRVLRRPGHSLVQLSAQSGRYYGSRSPYFIPPTFLHKLARGITPHVCQIVALSEITGYRFVDWMRLCGFDLQQIPCLQMRLHTERTVLVTPVGFERISSRPEGNTNRQVAHGSCNSHAPPGKPTGIEARFLFAKIGSNDAQVCPPLTPGGLVRADRRYALPMCKGDGGSRSDDSLWLVEHPGGLTCSQVRWIDGQHIVLIPSRPPWGSWPLRVPAEARILGLVDRFRPARPQELPARTPAASSEQLYPPIDGREALKLSDLLRVSRHRTGLTFREAHRLTGAIAQAMGNRHYTVALGLLSDYEAIGRLPRHIAKIISLCVAYCIDVRQLLAAAGVHIDDSEKAHLPTHDHFFQPHREEDDHAGVTTTVSLGAGYAASAGSLL
jgi:hypothetical protein